MDPNKNDDQLEMDLGDATEADKIEIEVVEDDADVDLPRLPEDHEAELPSDDEVASYSEGVQKRIKKLKFEYHEADRHKAEAIRVRDEAIQYAKAVAEENQRLADQLSQGQNVVAESAKARHAADIAAAEKDYRAAYESGDADLLLDAQKRLNLAQNNAQQAERWRPQQVRTTQIPEHLNTPDAAAETPSLSPRQKDWLAENTWFGKDPTMTGMAYGLHEEVVREGIDPDSELYYTRVDEGMRARFPDRFEQAAPAEEQAPAERKRPVVAAAGRSSGPTQKTRLTQRQLALAQRLGVPPEKYAAQILKDARNG